MAIVTVKNKYQVVIPQSVRKELGIEAGDILEAKVERGKLTYTRKAVIDRIVPAGKSERARFFKQLMDEAPEWLKSIQTASTRRGTDKLTKRQIDAEIAAVRRERHTKGKRPA
jgi:AbrB family looped-hinge helix DNA binding protein